MPVKDRCVTHHVAFPCHKGRRYHSPIRKRKERPLYSNCPTSRTHVDIRRTMSNPLEPWGSLLGPVSGASIFTTLTSQTSSGFDHALQVVEMGQRSIIDFLQTVYAIVQRIGGSSPLLTTLRHMAVSTCHVQMAHKEGNGDAENVTKSNMQTGRFTGRGGGKRRRV